MRAENNVNLIGRLTKDPEIKYTAGAIQMAVCKFTLAIDRVSRNEDKKTDFPRITVIGKQAESCERFLKKGSLVSVGGELRTWSYKKDDETIYVTEVSADSVKFLEYPKKEETVMPKEFHKIEEDIPF